MSRSHTLVYILIAAVAACQAQTERSALVQDPAFDKTIRKYLDFTVPVINCQDLREMGEEVILLDAREEEEYEVSHIEGAAHVGYQDFDVSSVDHLDKDDPIVVYCSIGYRSEKIAEQLQEAGFRNVRNLYGSIFEWVNRGFEVVDTNDQPTEKVHGYNRSWSKWISNPAVTKVW